MDPGRKRALIALGGSIATLIGLAAIAVPIMVDAGRTTSSVHSVESLTDKPAPIGTEDPLSSAPVVGELAHAIINVSSNGSANFWRIPVDAPFSTMPDGEMCNPAQMAWLIEHAQPGRPNHQPVETRVRNNADTGASMSLGNIHVQGSFVEQSQVVTLQCGGIGGGGSQVIELALDGSPGVWSEPMAWDQNPQPQGSIATLNLAPGEVADVTFAIDDSTKRFIGSIVADLEGSDSGTVVLVPELDFPSTPVPGYYLNFAGASIGLECSKPGSRRASCTFAEAEELLREAGRH